MVGTFRHTDQYPKELFVSHSAGLDGLGGSSYIDSVILRDRDMANGWSGAGDGVPEERHFYLQNWRADVVGLVSAGSGVPVERVAYSAYGVPRRIALSECNDDGVLDAFDYDDFTSDFAANQAQSPPPYDRRLDVNADGIVDSFDYDDFVDDYFASQGDTGRGVLSRGDIGSRRGYAGYEFEPALAGAVTSGPNDPTALYHVRHRVYDAQRGTWTRRDPIEHEFPRSVYEYLTCDPVTTTDPTGQQPASTLNPSAWIHVLINQLMAQGLTPAQIVAHLRSLGIGWPAIAAALGLTVEEVMRMVREEALPRRLPGPNRDKRNCSDEVLDKLQKAMHASCTGASCAKGDAMSCEDIDAAMIRIGECIAKRLEINRRCYQNTIDPTHYGQLLEVRNRMLKCLMVGSSRSPARPEPCWKIFDEPFNDPWWTEPPGVAPPSPAPELPLPPTTGAD